VTDDLSGQVGLVTGGGRGIGANVARGLAAATMRVAVSRRDLKLSTAAEARARARLDADAAGGLALSVAGVVTAGAALPTRGQTP
jgi:NAD(P)-dependent dehydrogenase (short-subunit alcohol dehydrogenase family)